MNYSKKLNYTIIIVVLLLLAACVSNKKVINDKIVFANNKIIAHRGAWKKNNLPQNSIASLRQAIELNCTGSEFDIRMSADNVLIVNHDPLYNNLEIEKTNFSELAAFKLSNGEKLPTLKEYLLAGIANNTTTRLICEIKPSKISKKRGQLIATKVVQLVEKLKAKDFVVYISFDYDMLKKIKEIDPIASTQYLESDKSPEQLKADGISGIDFYATTFKKQTEWIDNAKKNGLTLNAWTVNKVEDMEWFLANNFNFITTDEPELLLETIKKREALYKDYKLVWSDEFENSGVPDSTKWNYQIGGNGWGNGESQYYTSRPENAIIQNGILSIKVIKEEYKGNNYTSARINTKNKFSFKYGKVEIRAKQPSGGGVWPALWMLGDDKDKVGWPACGEIDIMEYAGNRINKVTAALHHPGHAGGNPDGGYTMITNADTEFHIYTLEWTPSDIKISVDNQQFFEFTNSSSIPFNHNFFLILNCAIGGHYGGAIAPDFSSSNFEIDYVRVFQKK